MRSFGSALEIMGHAWVGKCAGKEIKRYTLAYQAGFVTDPTLGAWTEFWQVDYATAMQKKAVQTMLFDLTSFWLHLETCIVPNPTPPPDCLLSIPYNELWPTRWQSGRNYPDVPVGLQSFPVDPEVPAVVWTSQQLPLVNCQSGRYTIRVDVEDTTGAHFYDVQHVWFDNKKIYGEIDQVAGVPACSTVNLSSFAAPGADCSVVWPGDLLGIAYDEYIEEGNTAIPSDNYAMVGGVVQGGMGSGSRRTARRTPARRSRSGPGFAAVGAAVPRHDARRRSGRAVRDGRSADGADPGEDVRHPGQPRLPPPRRRLQPGRAGAHAGARRVLWVQPPPRGLGQLRLPVLLRRAPLHRARLPRMHLQRPAEGTAGRMSGAGATGPIRRGRPRDLAGDPPAGERGRPRRCRRAAPRRARLGSGRAAGLMDCFQCLSVWVAAPASIYVTRDRRDAVPVWLALSGAACLLERAGAEPLVIEPIPEGGGRDAVNVARSERRLSRGPDAGSGSRSAEPDTGPVAGGGAGPIRAGPVRAQAQEHGALGRSVRGNATGRFYEFSGEHPVQSVDSRDAPALLATRFFRAAY